MFERWAREQGGSLDRAPHTDRSSAHLLTFNQSRRRELQ